MPNETIEGLKTRIQKYKRNTANQSITDKKSGLTHLSLCAEIVGTVFTGLIIGSGVDRLAGTQCLFKVICLIIGCAACLRVIYKTMK
jgi:F0F1-type ATP synthase assembly protein I